MTANGEVQTRSQATVFFVTVMLLEDALAFLSHWEHSAKITGRTSFGTVLLQADQRPKQNHKDVHLPGHPQKLYLLVKDFGLLNHKNIRSPIIQCRRN